MTYDASDGYVLLFGGYNGSYLGDTWMFKGGEWTQLIISGLAPSARDGASMVYDESGGYVLLFGGYDGAYLGDTWAFKASAWTQLYPSGTPPSAREGASMTYDDVSGTVLLFGGYDGSYFGDTFRFAGTSWTQLAPPAPIPSPRDGASMAFDSAGGFMLLFGGFDGAYLGDTWGFKGGNWTELSPSSPLPPSRDNASMAYDASGGSILLFGGYNGIDTGDTWEFRGENWTEATQATSVPRPREGASMAYDAYDGYILLFGGSAGSYLGDTWAFKNASMEGWAGGSGVSVGYGSTMAYDSSDGYILLFGGLMNDYVGDTWIYRGGTWTTLETPAHGPSFGSTTCYLYAAGKNTSRQTPCPSARYGATMTYDPEGGCVLLFGGNNGSYLGDTWEFKRGTWTQESVSSPSGRYFASMTYDESDGYVLLFGGNNGSYLGDTWKYEGGTWTQLTESKSPLGRSGEGMAFDESSGYVVLFGGYGCASVTCSAYVDLGDTWEFKGGTWTQLHPSTSPSVRYYLQMAYDTADGYLLLFGGEGCVDFPTCSIYDNLGDTWMFHGGAWMLLEAPAGGPESGSALCYLYGDGINTSMEVSCPTPRYGPVIAYDMGRGNILLDGGYSTGYLGDSWEYSFPPTLSPLGAVPSSIDLGQAVNIWARAYGGTYPYDYAYAGLPSGCSSANSTHISCIPVTAGVSTVTVTVEDGSGYSLSSSTSLTVYSTPKISSVVPSRSSVDVGQTVNFTATLAPGTNPHGTFAWNVSSTGLGCAHSNLSVLSCTPTLPSAAYRVRANLTDSAHLTSPNVSSSNFTVYADPVASTPVASVQSADIGQNVTFRSSLVSAGSGLDSYRWDGLPSGCVSSDTLVIGPCTVMAAGTYNVSIIVNDSNGFNETNRSLVFHVYGGPVVTIPVANRSSVDVWQTVELSSAASHGLGPFTYSWVAPGALGCNPSIKNTMTCSPSSPGNYLVSVSATDANGVTSTSEMLNYAVYADPSISSPTPSRTTVDIGQNVTFASVLDVAGSGGDIYAWSTSSPSLSCAASNESTALCTARAQGSYNVSVMVTDSNGGVGEASSAEIVVNTDPVIDGPVFSPSSIVLGQMVSANVTVTGGTPGYSYDWVGLPPGCQSAGSGLSCVPLTAGNFSVQVNVTDGAGYHASSKPVMLTVTLQASVVLQEPYSMEWELFGIMVSAPAIAAIASFVYWRRSLQGD
jgi:hypothetical protein